MSQQPWAALIVPADLDLPTLDLFCEFLVRLNERYLRGHAAPPLYRSGAFYRLQPEFWLTVPHAIVAIQTGRGLDCKSLAAWRTAELRVRLGEPARCIGSEHPTSDKTVYHVRVQRGDGRIEDPSAILGMNAALPAAPFARYALGP